MHAKMFSMICEDPVLLSRLRQTIFTGGAYRVAATTKARREANGSRHGEMPPDRTGHPGFFSVWPFGTIQLISITSQLPP